jgi:hypothetical protein
MGEVINTIVIVLVSSFGTVGLILLFIYLTPEKVEKWASMIGFCLTKLGGIFSRLHKSAVKLDLQGNINDYVKKVSKIIPTLERERVKVEYIDKTQDRKGFIDNNQVVLMLRRDDPKDLNFVHGAFLFVSTSLLFKAKRYISQSQRDALDLYVTTRLIEKEKPQRVDYFLEEYLHPKIQDCGSERKKYYDQLIIIDEGGYFYTILLEELNSLGGKVFGGRRDDKIIVDVRELIKFLEQISKRAVGTEDVDLDFQGEYCKASVVIVGKAETIARDASAPYIKFICDKLYPQNVDNVYLVGNIINKDVIDDICEDVSDAYDVVRKRVSKTLLHLHDNTTTLVDNYFVFLCRKGSSIIVPDSNKG